MTDSTPVDDAACRPDGGLEVERLTVVAPGRRVAALAGLSFAVPPGRALGVIGPSGAGKSALARALAGVWPAAEGRMRLDGAPLGRLGPGAPGGGSVGHLPQSVALFEGTAAQNIAGLARPLDHDEVRAAAEAAGAHGLIAGLPEGYDTWLGPGGIGLSGGETRRLGLARALCGGPRLLVLDEPEGGLDNEGRQALSAVVQGVKAAGRLAVIVGTRPSAIADCDLLLVLDGGRRREFGPRDEVLRRAVTGR